MGDKSNELVHVMPTNARVKLTFTRVDMKRDKNSSVFVYRLDDWNPNDGEAPTFTCSIDDWDTDDPADHGALHRSVRSSLLNGVKDVIIKQLGKK